MTSEPTPDAVGPDETLARMQAMAVGTLMERMGIELTHAQAERVEGRMPVAGNTQVHGILHGGASGVLAETLGSVASALHAGPDRIALGIELSCSHHRPAQDGFVYGIATPLSLGRSLATYAIAITDEQGRLVCTARLTCMLRDRPTQ